MGDKDTLQVCKVGVGEMGSHIVHIGLGVMAASIIASCPSGAGDQSDRFFEIEGRNFHMIYDLSTVNFIQPGRFTIVTTDIDDPDVMHFKLIELDVLLTYCAKPDGKYSAPESILALGPPDMPVKTIEVRTGKSGKFVDWKRPYTRLALNSGTGLQQSETSISCSWGNKGIDELRSTIMNGLRSKVLFDCKRGLEADLFNVDEGHPERALTHFVVQGTVGFQYYDGVCRRVTGEPPYVPQK